MFSFKDTEREEAILPKKIITNFLMFSNMKQKGEFTTLQRAIQTVDGFSHVFTTLRQQTALRGQSESTLYNYMHRIALVSLHFKRLPEDISDEELTEYLTSLALDANSPSRSGFKHTVYGLRYYYRHVGLSQRAVDLPSLKKELKLPVILNRSELRELFKVPTLLKHRIILALTYSGGLRSQEIIALKARASLEVESTASTRACFLARSISRSLIRMYFFPRIRTKTKESGAMKRVAK